MSDKTAGRMVHDAMPYHIVLAAAATVTKGQLVNEEGFYGFAFAAAGSGERYRLDHDDCEYYATKETLTDVLAVGAIVEFVAGGTVQARDEGVPFGIVTEASGATDATVRVKPVSALYLGS